MTIQDFIVLIIYLLHLIMQGWEWCLYFGVHEELEWDRGRQRAQSIKPSIISLTIFSFKKLLSSCCITYFLSSTQACMDKVRTNILMDILTIRDNVVALPDFVKQLVRQYEDGIIVKKWRLSYLYSILYIIISNLLSFGTKYWTFYVITTTVCFSYSVTLCQNNCRIIAQSLHTFPWVSCCRPRFPQTCTCLVVVVFGAGS